MLIFCLKKISIILFKKTYRQLPKKRLESFFLRIFFSFQKAIIAKKNCLKIISATWGSSNLSFFHPEPFFFFFAQKNFCFFGATFFSFVFYAMSHFWNTSKFSFGATNLRKLMENFFLSPPPKPLENFGIFYHTFYCWKIFQQ